jgi:hypothetical protein
MLQQNTNGENKETNKPRFKHTQETGKIISSEFFKLCGVIKASELNTNINSKT